MKGNKQKRREQRDNLEGIMGALVSSATVEDSIDQDGPQPTIDEVNTMLDKASEGIAAGRLKRNKRARRVMLDKVDEAKKEIAGGLAVLPLVVLCPERVDGARGKKRKRNVRDRHHPPSCCLAEGNSRKYREASENR